LCQLVSDDGLRREWLAKDFSLVDPFETFLDDTPLAASRGTTHHPAFMVEVASWRKSASASSHS